ncbi:MAG: preprotein translocase subunit YajC [Gammaproteobacteria bacterium]|nr:preprotein translocase subunit YajC [Gammaproteobacteria bacterium]
MFLITIALAQGAKDVNAAQGQGSFIVLLPMYLIIFLVFYFLLIKPQQKKQKEHQKIISQLKKNDEVITSGGIHGTVINVKDNTVVLRVDDNVKIEFQKAAIANVEKSRKAE